MTDTPMRMPKRFSSKPYSVPETGLRLPGTQLGSAPTEISASEGSLALAPVIGIDTLYSAAKGSTSRLISALGLLAESIDFLARARLDAQKNRPIEADGHVQHFEAILPALFACRKIGDGYAVVINSLYFAAINRRGKSLNLEQITTVWRVLKELRNRPFIEFEQGLEYVGELEACGFEVDSPKLSELLEAVEE